MAKKKDITRNPPSWLEKGLFISIILIIIAIAFPIFWRLNASTRQFYACVSLQNELEDSIKQWRADTGAPDIVNPSDDVLRTYYGKEIPSCPADSTIKLFANGRFGCRLHQYDYRYETLPSSSAD